MNTLKHSLTAKEAESQARSLSQDFPLVFATWIQGTFDARPGGSRSTVTETWLFAFKKSKSEHYAVAVTRGSVKVVGSHGAIPRDVNTYPSIKAWLLDSDEALKLA